MTSGPTATAPTPTTAPPLPTEPADFAPLDPRALRLWQLGDLLAFVALLLIGLVIAVAAGVSWPPAVPWLAAAWVAFALLGAWTILYYHPRNFRAWGYRLDERVLLVRRGVWWRTVKLLPLPRLQHVDVKRGPLQRHFGLATLVLHTAGTQAAAIEVPGLDADEAVRLRDRLVAAGGDDGV